MSKHELYPILVVTLSFLLAIPFLACSQPVQNGFTTYENNTWEYTISYPTNWSVVPIDPNTTEIWSPSPSLAHIEIYADHRFDLAIEVEIQIWLEGTMKAFGDVILHESIGTKDSWDWYLSYNYSLREHNMTFHGEAYMKQTEENFYRICLEAEKGDYSQYPFGEVISTFALLGES